MHPQYFAELRPDGVLVFDDFGRAVHFISKERTTERNPGHPEEAWEAVLDRIRKLCCLIP